jgi:hypothetical protein
MNFVVILKRFSHEGNWYHFLWFILSYFLQSFSNNVQYFIILLKLFQNYFENEFYFGRKHHWRQNWTFLVSFLFCCLQRFKLLLGLFVCLMSIHVPRINLWNFFLEKINLLFLWARSFQKPNEFFSVVKWSSLQKEWLNLYQNLYWYWVDKLIL